MEGCAVTVNQSRVRYRKRAIVQSFRENNEQRVQKTPGLELVMGTAMFVSPKAVEVRLNGGDRRLSADHIFINTGTRAKHPPIAGLDGVPFLDNSSIMELDAVPEHLLVLGGGYIGVEFGQITAVRLSYKMLAASNSCAIS